LNQFQTEMISLNYLHKLYKIKNINTQLLLQKITLSRI